MLILRGEWVGCTRGLVWFASYFWGLLKYFFSVVGGFASNLLLWRLCWWLFGDFNDGDVDLFARGFLHVSVRPLFLGGGGDGDELESVDISLIFGDIFLRFCFLVCFFPWFSSM